ncbi:hypothetical protein BYT27DRAFT_7249264 [Phlegmacium glaucopus]|nr:hypothetical protein BYT27DRAFT_7249264 [Phlegmacium glaucopus]
MPITTCHQSHPNPNKVDDPKSSSNDAASTVGNRRKRQESNADMVDAPKRHKKQTKKGNGRKTALERAAEDITSSASGVPPHLTPAEHTLVVSGISVAPPERARSLLVTTPIPTIVPGRQCRSDRPSIDNRSVPTSGEDDGPIQNNNNNADNDENANINANDYDYENKENNYEKKQNDYENKANDYKNKENDYENGGNDYENSGNNDAGSSTHTPVANSSTTHTMTAHDDDSNDDDSNDDDSARTSSAHVANTATACNDDSSSAHTPNARVINATATDIHLSLRNKDVSSLNKDVHLSSLNKVLF